MHDINFWIPMQLQCVVMVKCVGVISTVTNMAQQRCALTDDGQIFAHLDLIKVVFPGHSAGSS